MSARPHADGPLRRAILLRHGRTAWNAEGRWQGREDVPLDGVGLRQAETAAEMLVRDGSITRVITSPARRAAQTATVLKGAFDLAGRPVGRATDDRLVEIDVGRWSGLTREASEAQFSHEFDALARGEDVPYGECGERLSEAVSRVESAVVDAVDGLSGNETVVVVTHGAVIRGVAGSLAGLPLAVSRRVLDHVDNCHWVTLARHPDRWVIERWNAGV